MRDPLITYCEDEGFAPCYEGPFSGLAFPTPELAAEVLAALEAGGVWADPHGGVVALA